MEISRGITNIWQISQNKNISTDVPLKIRFFLPPTAYGLTHLPLSYSIQPFETYSAVTASGTSHTHLVEILAHTHPTTLFELPGPNEPTYQICGVISGGTTMYLAIPQGTPGGIDFNMASSGGGGVSQSSGPDTSHTHPISASLGTSAADVTAISISIDGVDKTSVIETALGRTLRVANEEDESDIELFSYLSTPVLNAWHEVVITPTGIESPAGMCYMYAFISPESVIKQV